MSCVECSRLSANVDLSQPYCTRTCRKCGQDFNVQERPVSGIGFIIQKDDRVTVPAGFISVSANPLKGGGTLTRSGVSWFAEMIFGTDIAVGDAKENFIPFLEKIQEESEAVLLKSELVHGLNLELENDQMEVNRRVQKDPKAVEWWAWTACVFANIAQDMVTSGDANGAAWATATAERFRMMTLFKENFEEVVAMGQSACQLLDLLKVWSANRNNDNEAFWQEIIGSNAFALSQLFSSPVTFIGERAYVGGQQIDGKDARLLDFLLAEDASEQAILVEIKTPTSKLLGGKYRSNAFVPGRDVSGSIVQVNDYADSLSQDIQSICRTSDKRLVAFNPRRIILVGDYSGQLTDQRRRHSFDLYRNSLGRTEIVTFDEFFLKIERLAQLFGLKRTPV